MAKHYLAVDLGAESGRFMLGQLAHRRLGIKELHRFPNRILTIKGHLHWNINYLYREITKGLQIYASLYKTRPQSIAIDTWGVDFGLLDTRAKLIEQPYTYRDHRTKGMMERFFKVFPKERLYKLTGIQMMSINTIFQLYSMFRHNSPSLRKAHNLLFIPDILNYYLTGVKTTEFTFATTSQLFNPVTQDWDEQILKALGIPRRIMPDIIQSGSIIGNLKLAGWTDVPVVAVGSHDTASAVAAIPAEGKGYAYISSGTWSLMGIETKSPIINAKSMKMNFTNEGGVGGTYRFLKNIMGLWLLQQCRRCWPGQQDYGRLVTMAHKAPTFQSIIDPDYPEFLNPSDMAASIRQYCRQTNQPPPDSPAQFTRCILESLALKYRYVLEQLNQFAKHPIRRIHIIGGGARNKLLCQFTADATGLPVIAGPTEATAIGNIMVQAMASGGVGSLADARTIIKRSFNLEIYRPECIKEWDRAYDKFLALI